MEYEYKHSKLKIIGTIGFVGMFILSGILTIGFNISSIDVAGVVVSCMALFGILIMVGLFNEM